MKSAPIISISLILLTFAAQLYSEEGKVPSTSNYPLVETQKKGNPTPFPEDNATRKIIIRNKLQHEGYFLARQGFYEEALLKFRASMDPSLLNYDYDKAGGECGIKDVYICQGKFEQALQIVEDNLKSLPAHTRVVNDNIFSGNDELTRQRLELQALIKARDTRKNEPIYEYVDYVKVKSKYNKLLPPKGYEVGISDWLIDDLIHLYDYIHDYAAGIAFMDEIIKYHSQHPDKAHRSAHAKDVKEYTRVKEAWELDKKTDQHGHLQEVIKTSDVIGW